MVIPHSIHPKKSKKMKKMKKFFTVVFNILIVLVPLCLMGSGLWLTTGVIWDALFVLSMIAFGLFAWSKYRSINAGQDWQGNGLPQLAAFGSLGAFMLLTAQLLFAAFMKNPVCPIPAEAAVIWLFFLIIILGVSELKSNRPDNGYLTFGISAAITWLGLCCIGGCIDILEFLTEFEMPERIMSVLGMIAGITAICAMIFVIIGIFKENRR